MFALLACVAFVPLALGQSTYFLGKQGDSCTQTCLAQGMNCNPAVQTGNSSAIFTSLGVKCNADPRPWWAEDQPSFVSNSSDPNTGDCLGW